MVTIQIVDGGHNKLRTVKILKDLTEMGLKEAKDIVDQEGIFQISEELVDSAINAFVEVGATALVVKEMV